jgi:hypothetical protein
MSRRPAQLPPARLSATGPGGPGLDAPGGGTLVEEELGTRPDAGEDYRYDEGDHERYSHYAPKDKIMEAMVTGTPVRALCGKVWVPSRDPKRFPVCPACKEVYEALPPGGGQ